VKIGVAFGICVILFTVFAGDRGLPAVIKARRQSAELASEIGRLRAANTGLRGRAEALRTDPATIERIARESLGFVRADELIVIASVRPSGGQ